MGNAPLPKPIAHRLEAERKGESQVLRHPSVKDGPLLKCAEPDVLTLYDAFTKAAEKYPDNRCLGWREGESEYKWMSYKTVKAKAQAIGSGLVKEAKLTPHESKIGVYSINRVEWALTEQAANAYSLCLVPLYDTLGPDVCSYIVNQAELSCVICSGDKIELLLKQDHPMPVLKTIVCMDKPSDEVKERARGQGLHLISFHEVEEIGLQEPLPVSPPQPDELSTICYTSGTTGNPKGVMLSHGNFIADLAGAFVNGIKPNPGDVHISYLPLAHVFERVVMNAVWYFGAAAGFYRGDVRKLFDDIAELKPTIFPSVPRLWNNLYEKVMTTVKNGSFVTSNLFEVAYAAKQEGLKEGYYTHAVWDSTVFASVKAKLGGNIRLMITGSAPLAPYVMEFLRICFACPVVEGYGQTECSAACAATPLESTEIGNVGFPLPSVEIKLVDVPEMNYFTTDKPNPRGEICLRGPICCKGYYKEEAKTKELIDANGWYHTGDIGEFLPTGALKITDRVKNIFKLSHGEYIAPEKVENSYLQSPFVAQIYVHGESIKSCLIAIVVPSAENLLAWAKEHGKPEDLAKLVLDPEVNAMILKDMDAIAKVEKLRGFEVVKAIHLSDKMWSPADFLTPTFKLKRPQVAAAFKDQLAEMYKDFN